MGTGVGVGVCWGRGADVCAIGARVYVWVWALACTFCDWRLICLIAPMMPPGGCLTVGGRRLWPASGLALGCAVVSGCGRFTSHDSASGLRMVRVGPRLVPSPNEAAR